ncbi:uncharacterized protein LOC1272111 [Anopheles gambiae]|uniref:uncharacterized protein LOC1272111 n=1 Tax=Anopheles gambiae TaxID=7165 RepID=UPI002AC9D476|nr:uncharacterized protein LOC1272111 [Anopheles gambiae]
MKFYSVGKLVKVLLVMAVCCLLLCTAPTGANPLPGRDRNTIANKSKDKKASAPKHSLGTGARMALTGGGVLGGVLTSM